MSNFQEEEMAQESDKKNKYTPPEAGKRDVVHTIARAGISSIPVIGGRGFTRFRLDSQ